MVYDPNSGSGEWKFFQGLDGELSGTGDQGNDPGRNTWGDPGSGPGNRGGGQESGSPSGFGLGQARTPRISAAGFDIDTGKYHGPTEPIGYDPDTGRAIWPGQGQGFPGRAGNSLTQDTGAGGFSLPGGLRDAHPAAKVLWAVQNDLVPHLKGVPAIDEYGGIHPAYARALGVRRMGLDGADEGDTTSQPSGKAWWDVLSPDEAEAGTRNAKDGRFETDAMKRVQKDRNPRDPIPEWFMEKGAQMQEAYREAIDWVKDKIDPTAGAKGSSPTSQPSTKEMQK